MPKMFADTSSYGIIDTIAFKKMSSHLPIQLGPVIYQITVLPLYMLFLYLVLKNITPLSRCVEGTNLILE